MSVRYRNKAPFQTLRPDACHWTRKGNSWKQKESYHSEDEAWEYLNQNPRLKSEGMTVYRCNVCSLWHCGHVSKDIEFKERGKDL